MLRLVHLGSNGSKPNYAALRKVLVVQAARRLRGKNAILPEQLSTLIDVLLGSVGRRRRSCADLAPLAASLHGVSLGNEFDEPIHYVRLFLPLEQAATSPGSSSPRVMRSRWLRRRERAKSARVPEAAIVAQHWRELRRSMARTALVLAGAATLATLLWWKGR